MKDFADLIGFLSRCARSIGFSRRLIFLALLSAFLSGAVSTGFIALINMMLTHRGSRPVLLWSFVALCLALPLARFTSNVLLLRLVQKVLFDLRLRLCGRILATPLQQLERIGPARLLATLTEDVAAITGAVGNIPMTVLHVGVVVAAFAYLGFLSWPLLLAFLGMVILGILSYQLPVLKAHAHFRLMRRAWDRLFEALRGLTQGTKELKIHSSRREAFFDEVVAPAAEDLRRHTVVGGTIYAAANSWGQTLFFVVIGFVLFGLPAIGGIDQQVVSGFTLIVLFLMNPLDVLLNMLPDLGAAAVSVHKVEELGLSLEASAATPDVLPGSVRPRTWRRLELVDVSHTYFTDDGDEPFTLGPLSVAFEPGELVFIVGGNGSGKTTLAKLLIGLYAPEGGDLRLDGAPVTGENRDSFRQLFSVVFSDFFLFNTLLGVECSERDARAKEYLAELRLDHKVKVERGQLSTLDLSQGQRKRLALLTAYLEDRPIYLFDEWAADQDPYFKEIFYRHLVPDLRARGKTILIISHDDHYYHTADRILKLLDGGIEFDGEAESYLEFMARTDAVQREVR